MIKDVMKYIYYLASIKGFEKWIIDRNDCN